MLRRSVSAVRLAVLAGLVVAGVGHAPAAATTLLVASGIAGPGKPLIGLVIGLVIVLVLAAALAWLTDGRAPVPEADATFG